MNSVYFWNFIHIIWAQGILANLPSNCTLATRHWSTPNKATLNEQKIIVHKVQKNNYQRFIFSTEHQTELLRRYTTINCFSYQWVVWTACSRQFPAWLRPLTYYRHYHQSTKFTKLVMEERPTSHHFQFIIENTKSHLTFMCIQLLLGNSKPAAS